MKHRTLVADTTSSSLKDYLISPFRKRKIQSVTIIRACEPWPSDSRFEDTDVSPPQKQHNGHLTPSLQPGTDSAYDTNLHPDIFPRQIFENNGNMSYKADRKIGLISGKDIREETERKKKEDLLRFKLMDPSISGFGAEPVYRDKTEGDRISKGEYLKSKQKVEEKPKEKEIVWVKGLAQKREAEASFKELELEKDKRFAWTRGDPELEKMLKERIRWGDPMAHLVKKKYLQPVLQNLGESEKMKESGFIIPQDIPDHSWLKKGLDAAPNRCGIRPGRHYDGVDHSNGFEKDLFKRMNGRQARDKEAYLWSVSGM